MILQEVREKKASAKLKIIKVKSAFMMSRQKR
jgi:hypothetical protein